jgi:hypothetical protein
VRSWAGVGREARVALMLSAVAVFVVTLRLLAPGSTPQAGPSAAPPTTGAPSSARGMAAGRSDDGYRCPPSAPVAAYGARLGHHFFDPAHPRHPPPSLEPDGCFASNVLAQAAGYTKGILPQGWEEFDGWYLAPDTDLGVDPYRLCFRASQRLGFAVGCPHLLPPPGAVSGLPRCGTAFPANPGCVYRPDPTHSVHVAFSLQYASFLDASGRPVGGQGLTVAAFPADEAPPGSDFEWQFLCGGAKPLDRVPLVFPWSYQPTASDGRFVECAEGALAPPSAGQTLLWWRIGSQTFVIGMPGDLAATRNVLRDLAASVEIYEPTG